MIVLAREITDARAGQEGMGLLDIAVRRNGYGRQVDSFEAGLQIEGIGDRDFPGVFIRAPLVESIGATHVIGSYDGHPVALKQGHITAFSFHPELSGDLRLHREFVRMAANGGA